MLASVGLFTGSGVAGTITAPLVSTVTVPAACKNLSAGTLAFGSYTPDASSDTTKSQTISVTCTMGTAVTIALGAGATAGATTAARKLSDGNNNTLNYQLYSDAAMSMVWDDASNRVAGSGAGMGTPKVFTVYGKIPGGQLNAVAGNYSDTVTVTVSY